MAILEWKPEYSVGVLLLDAQHQRWFEMFNQLSAAMRTGHAEGIRDDILKQMVTYTKTHFRSEEDYLQQQGYPELGHHKLLHQQFAHQLSELESKLQEGRLQLTIRLLETLRDWLLSHVLKEDARYAAYLSRQQS